MTAPVVARTSDTVIPLALGVGVSLLVAAVVNVAATVGFPGNAPVEQLYSFGITIDLLVAGIVLVVRASVHRRRPRAAAAPPRAGTLAIVALVLAVASVLATLFLGGIDNVALAADGERLRYMNASAGAFYSGAAWSLSFIFGVVGYRTGGGRVNAVLSTAALVLSGVVLVFLLVASISYGLALTD